jgi:diguanylate cyclase (GGDEF)-like protein/PAS domain S-box-containing protein
MFHAAASSGSRNATSGRYARVNHRQAGTRASGSPPPAAHSSRPTLATWLFVAVLGATLAAVLMCTLISEHFARHKAAADATQYLQTNADALRDALDRGMAQNFEQVRIMGRLEQLSAGRDPALIRRTLEEMQASFPEFAWLGLAGADGKVLAAVGGLLQGRDISGRPWFPGAQNGMYVGDVHDGLLLAKLLPPKDGDWRFVDIATPVTAPDGSLRGVLCGHLSWDWALRIKRELVDTAMQRHQAEALVVGTDGTVLLGPAELQGRRLPHADASIELSVESRTRGSGRYPGLGWNVVLRQPQDVAMAAYSLLQERTRLAAGALCLLFAPLIWLLARRLATPMRELGEQLDESYDGTSVPRRHPLYREADLLGQALDRYARRQHDDALRLRDLNVTLETRVEERTAALALSNEELSLAVRERRHSEDSLRALTDLMPALVSRIDTDLRYRFMNAAYARLLGFGVPQALGMRVSDIVGADVFHSVEPQLRRALAGESVTFESDLVVNGRPMHNLVHYIPDLDEEGAVQGIYSMALDLTPLANAERRSAAGEQRLRTITDNLPVLISYIDRSERYQFVNGTYRDWLGMEQDRIIGRTMAETLGAEEYALRCLYLQRALAGERVDFDIESMMGGVPRYLRSTYLPDAVDGGVYILVSDISATKAAEKQLEMQARTDSLTGLPNRHAFNEVLDAALARSRRNGTPIALFFIDVDRFKAINDSLGHGAGDQVLRMFGERLRASVRDTDTVARLAGDEFVVVLEGLHTPDEPQFIARKVLAAISRPFDFDSLSLDITTSIGIAYRSHGGVPSAELLAEADRALYEAKDGGRNTFRMAAA